MNTSTLEPMDALYQVERGTLQFPLHPSRPFATLCICREGDNNMTNPLLQLKALRQSVWLDDIDRGQLRSGLFGRMVDEDGFTGATGNPTIFEHSITHDTTYDEQMRQLQAEGVQKLIDSFQKLFQCIESKQHVLQS